MISTRRSFLGALACLPFAPKVLPRLAEIRPTVFSPVGDWELLEVPPWTLVHHGNMAVLQPRLHSMISNLLPLQQEINDQRALIQDARRHVYLPGSNRWADMMHFLANRHRWRYVIRYRRSRPPVYKWRKAR